MLAFVLVLSCSSSRVFADDSEDLTNLNMFVHYYVDGYFLYSHEANYDTSKGYFVQSSNMNNYFKISDKYSSSTANTIKIRFLMMKEGLLCEKGKEYTIKLDGIVPSYCSIPSETYSTAAQFAKALSPRLEIIYTDGSNEYIDLESSSYYYNSPNKSVSISYSFTPSKDVARVYFESSFVKSQMYCNGYMSSGTFDTSYYLITKLNKVSCTFTSEPETVELLTGITGWIQNLYNNITGVINGIGGLPANIWAKMSSSFSSIISNGGDILTSLGSVLSYLQNMPSSIWNKMSSSFTSIINGNSDIVTELGNLFGSITNLPGLIWDKMSSSFTGLLNSAGNILAVINNLPSIIVGKIETAFTGLFVPSEEKITSFKDDCQALIKSHFGAVYESVDYVIDFVKMFQNKEAIDVVDFPSITLNFSGTDFTFGGYTVDLIADEMEDVVKYLKWGISIICTLAVINSMKNRFTYEFLEK